jgi:pseudaminic acid biosynthesis-associated methylase
MATEQIKFWQGEFGKNYTDRNNFDEEEWDKKCIEIWGVTKLQMNEACLGNLSKHAKILEVGCNVGMQLRGLQKMGFTNLYGIEIQAYAVEKAKSVSKDINIIQGSGFDIPFKDGWFDLVFTNGVLIHISPTDYANFMSEMVRTSSKYIMGFEYYDEQPKELPYRGNNGYLWKTDFGREFVKRFPELRLVYKKLYPYKVASEVGNVDCMYLIEKTK